MDELGVARAIRDGDLPSPQTYDNVHLFAIRITGTGHAYRSAIDEHVWRDKSLYLNDDFLERCQGLAVIWVHPESSVLNSKEFADRVIGSVMLPYIKDDEIWGVAKIYDDEAAEVMATRPISTSPGVKLDPASRSMLTNDDGEKLLVEGKLSLLDHIAVVTAGVWDKGGPPTGVQNDQLERVDSMPTEEEMADRARKDAEEKKEREDRARRDADAGQKLDKILTHLDAVSARMDALEEKDKARKDAEDKEKKDRADAARKDARAKMDAERDDWAKADAEQCAKDDAEEEAHKKKMEEEGEPEEVAADKARKDRKDRMDARRKDAEEAEKKSKAEEEERKDAAGVKEQLAALNRKLAAFEVAHTPVADDVRTIQADEQARNDGVYIALGGRAPAPMSGEASLAYRIRLARGLQKHSKQWKDIDLQKLDASVLDVAAAQIRNDAMIAARSPEDLETGQLREIIETDVTGRRISKFVGRGTFIGAMRQPSRRLTNFNVNKGA